MNPVLRGKLLLLAEFCIFGAVAGMVFQLLHEGFINFMAFIIGIPLGAAYGLIELFLLAGCRKLFLKLPFLLTAGIKAIVYLFFINLVTFLLYIVVGFTQGVPWEEFLLVMQSKDQIIINLYTLLIYVLCSFYIQVNLLLGRSVMLKFLLGKYREPIEENRIFMFLDLKSSTSLAEELGLVKYYSLLNDFFHEISRPALATKAEIYQYVGDEVIFTWNTTDGVEDSNCLSIFYRIKMNVYNNRKHYRRKYGVVPKFKAGLHYGQVISAQIGDIKREIVYNGDVLNTSARIQDQCNHFGEELLISGQLLEHLDLEDEYRAERMDSLTLRGKSSPIEIYSINEF